MNVWLYSSLGTQWMQGEVGNLESMVSVDCTVLFEQVIIMRTSCFDTDFDSQIKLTKFIPGHWSKYLFKKLEFGCEFHVSIDDGLSCVTLALTDDDISRRSSDTRGTCTHQDGRPRDKQGSRCSNWGIKFLGKISLWSVLQPLHWTIWRSP